MKNLLKIGALSLALIATVFMLNTTKAATGELTLEITGTSGYCTYGESIDLSGYVFQYSGYTVSGAFLTTTGTTIGAARRYCVDSYGVDSWNLTLQSSEVKNITTNNIGHTIPATSVKVRSATGALAQGSCTIVDGDSDGDYVAINSGKILFGKSAAYGEACEVGTDNVRLSVDLADSQAIGQYSGTLTIGVPNL